MRITKANSPSVVLHIEQRKWLTLMDTIDLIYDVLPTETRDNLRYGYGQTVGYPLIDKMATALEQFLEDNRGMERVEIDVLRTIEVECVRDFIDFIRLAQEIQAR